MQVDNFILYITFYIWNVNKDGEKGKKNVECCIVQFTSIMKILVGVNEAAIL